MRILPKKIYFRRLVICGQFPSLYKHEVGKTNFMNNRMTNFLTARNSKWNLASGILVLLLLVLGCSRSGNTGTKTAEKPTPPGYVGVWTAADGSTVTLRNDGSGDYKSGGKTVSGAAVEIDETAKEIRFSFMGFDSGKYKIDQAPANNRMKLDGMEYRRTGGFDANDSTTDGVTTGGEIPTEDELRPLVGDTLQSFDEAVKQKEFGDFYSNISETWQNQTTAAALTEAFSPLFKQKTDFVPKDGAVFVFTPKPTIEKDNTLKVEVNYTTVLEKKAVFHLRYIKEAAGWKLLGIRLNP